MEPGFFDSGMVRIGAADVAFEKRVVQGRFSVYLPSDFIEEGRLLSKYSYFFSQDKSPLSIAIRFNVGCFEDRKRMISHYFSQGVQGEPLRLSATISYRETIAASSQLSIYSLRFAAEEPEGILFGCFNSSAREAEDWKPVVLNMLQHIQRN